MASRTSHQGAHAMRSTIVLVHGAFAESAGWDRVIDVLMSRDHRLVTLSQHGHRPIAAASPLRGLATDVASGAGGMGQALRFASGARSV
jgi:pimeloyl-ACP methyl ester carboxylesterase